MRCPVHLAAQFAEIRCSDVPATSLQQFKDYVAKYSGGPKGRFLDPHFTHSSPVRLYHRSQAHDGYVTVIRLLPDRYIGGLGRHEGTVASSVHASHALHALQADMARYLLNYMGRDRRYTEKVRNCQAFAADMYSFVAGKKGIEVTCDTCETRVTHVASVTHVTCVTCRTGGTSLSRLSRVTGLPPAAAAVTHVTRITHVTHVTGLSPAAAAALYAAYPPLPIRPRHVQQPGARGARRSRRAG